MKLKGKTAFITGSTRGVGQQIALGLARLGCNIIVHGRTFENCKKTLGLLEEFQIDTYSVHGDLSKDSEIDHIILQVNQIDAEVDILYNNAAIMTPYREDIWSHTSDEWVRSYQVNVVATYKFCAAFIPRMIERNYGRVINMTSRITDQPQLAPYGATKWAVDKLSQDFAFALKETNVRMNYLDPTWLKTDLGGEHADNEVEAVLPGALEPALIGNDGPNGEYFCAVN